MPNYPSIDADTLAEVISAAGTNAAEQAWVAGAVRRGIVQSPWSKIIGGALSGRPILNVLAAQKLKGSTVNLQVEAPFGGKLHQGSGATRTGNGEKDKFKMFTFTVDVGWKGAKWNNAASYRSLLGTPAVRGVQQKLSDWHKRYQADCIEATLLANKHALNTHYCGTATSEATLKSADTFVANDVARMKSKIIGLGGMPFNMAKKNNQEINVYYAQLCNKLTEDMERSGDWTQLLADSRERGDGNELYTGFLPTWMGNALNRWEVPNNDATGPQGAFCQPIAYLGEAIIALPVTGTALKGGRNAAGAAETDPQYFQYFQNAPFTGYHGTIIGADTSTERYLLIRNTSGADVGKFGMYAYQVNNGNQITLTKALRASAATSGKIDQTTVGSVTWGTAPWTTGYLTTTHPVGSEIIQCNALGQPFVYGFVLGSEAITTGYGRGSNGLAMGGLTTNENQNHGLESEVGLEYCWGCGVTTDADGVVANYGVIVGAWNPDGLPTIT